MIRYKSHIFYLMFFLILAGVFYFLNIVIGPLLLAFFLAYLLNPAFEYFEKRGVKRSWTALTFLVIFGLLVFLIVWVVFPIFYNQVLTLLKYLPEFQSYLDESLFPKIHKILKEKINFKLAKPLHTDAIIIPSVEQFKESFFARIGASTKILISIFVTTIFTPFFLFFIMKDLQVVLRYVLSLVPIGIRPSFLGLIFEIDQKIKSVLYGQALLILILSLLYPSVLFAAGLPAGIAVGLIIAFARLVPYLDTTLGIFLGFFVLATNRADPVLIWKTIIAFGCVQLLDMVFLTPKIMGRASGLHPFLVILAVLCFGQRLGFYGVLAAVPLAAILKVAVVKLIRAYKNSKFFQSI